MRDEWRRVTEDIMVLGALAYMSASNFDKTEIRLITAYGAYIAGRALTAGIPKKKLGYAWPELVAASILVLCVAVKCGHEFVAHYWATVAVYGDVRDLENHLAGIGQ